MSDKYNKKFDETKKKIDKVFKQSQDRKSKMVTASDRPYSQKVLENTKAMLGMKAPLSKRDDKFGDMKNTELDELYNIYKGAYGDTRISATPIGILNTVQKRHREKDRRRNLEKNLEYVDPIIGMGEPTGFSKGKKVKKKSIKKIRGSGIAKKGVRPAKMR